MNGSCAAPAGSPGCGRSMRQTGAPGGGSRIGGGQISRLDDRIWRASASADPVMRKSTTRAVPPSFPAVSFRGNTARQP
jgi:hypothetical protein